MKTKIQWLSKSGTLRTSAFKLRFSEQKTLTQAGIIFIHGLRKILFKTWTIGAVCWPRDFLSILKMLESSRGYDSSFVNVSKLAS